MIDFQSLVEDFMRTAGQVPVSTKSYHYLPPQIRDGELRKTIIQEEAKEFADAIEANDLPGAVDACIDLLYVTFGALAVFGVDAVPYFRAVHEANMAKFKNGVLRREDGKIIKPEGWEPPDIAAMVALDTEMRAAGALSGPFGDPDDPNDPLDWRKK